MLTTNLKKIESFLPVFTGFYNTIFEPDEDIVIESPFTYSDYEFDYETYKNDIIKECIFGISDKLEEFNIFGIKIKYQLLSSPKYYNFSNDKIFVEYKLNKKAINSINEYLNKYKKEFAKYIKDNYTSYDGFMSFYSNDIEVWETEYLKDKNKLEHCFGAILQFIFKNEGYSDNDLYIDYCNGIYLYGELIAGFDNAKDYIETYAKDNYINKDIDIITNEIKDYFEVNYKDFSDTDSFLDYFNLKQIKDIVLNIFNSIDKHTLKFNF